ncbi:hypothetical protein IWZ03DRAFT_16837 [Phyllosticta citriasiana]|uniref:Uncharacterized protein n=1 Tax=Phyllosticta citriasiana TaxID=595635 RepID=A0ABR1KZD9_9PEZI
MPRNPPCPDVSSAFPIASASCIVSGVPAHALSPVLLADPLPPRPEDHARAWYFHLAISSPRLSRSSHETLCLIVVLVARLPGPRIGVLEVQLGDYGGKETESLLRVLFGFVPRSRRQLPAADENWTEIFPSLELQRDQRSNRESACGFLEIVQSVAHAGRVPLSKVSAAVHGALVFWD